MNLFIIAYLLIYSGMQLYFFVRLRAAFPGLGWWEVPIAIVLAALVFLPLLGRWTFMFFSFGWLIPLFWFVCIFFVCDLWNLSIWAIAHSRPSASAVHLPAIVQFIGAVIIMTVGVFYGMWEAANIRIIEINVPLAHLTGPPIRIAQITDVHLGPILGKNRTIKVAGMLEKLQPDIIVSTGDLVDASFDKIRDLSGFFEKLHPPLGKFAVTGNHEYYADIRKSIKFHNDCGFQMLRNTDVLVDNRLIIAGVDDPVGHPDEDAALPGAASTAPVVLLKHRPQVAKNSLGRFNLQLSGHLHGGQIFPFSLLVRLENKYPAGLYRLGNEELYTSRGTGTWAAPVRLFAPPEITVFTLIPR